MYSWSRSQHSSFLNPNMCEFSLWTMISTSLLGGNQVDGLPAATSLISSQKTPKRSNVFIKLETTNKLGPSTELIFRIYSVFSLTSCAKQDTVFGIFSWSVGTWVVSLRGLRFCLLFCLLPFVFFVSFICSTRNHVNA